MAHLSHAYYLNVLIIILMVGLGHIRPGVSANTISIFEGNSSTLEYESTEDLETTAPYSLDEETTVPSTQREETSTQGEETMTRPMSTQIVSTIIPVDTGQNTTVAGDTGLNATESSASQSTTDVTTAYSHTSPDLELLISTSLSSLTTDTTDGGTAGGDDSAASTWVIVLMGMVMAAVILVIIAYSCRRYRKWKNVSSYRYLGDDGHSMLDHANPVFQDAEYD